MVASNVHRTADLATFGTNIAPSTTNVAALEQTHVLGRVDSNPCFRDVLSSSERVLGATPLLAVVVPEENDAKSRPPQLFLLMARQGVDFLPLPMPTNGEEEEDSPFFQAGAETEPSSQLFRQEEEDVRRVPGVSSGGGGGGGCGEAPLIGCFLVGFWAGLVRLPEGKIQRRFLRKVRQRVMNEIERHN